jgi:hypothetical protein
MMDYGGCMTAEHNAWAGIIGDIGQAFFSKNMLTAKHWLFHTRQ